MMNRTSPPRHHRLLIPPAITAISIFLLLTNRSIHAVETFRIKIDPQKTYQTIDGFGASDAWRCDIIGKNWPQAKRERIAELLFSCETDERGNPRGIGLSIWRFNIGAGTAEQGDASGIKNRWTRTECFLNAENSYDWNKQAGQQWFLQAARKRGVEKLLAFPNSPPVHLTANGKGYAPKGRPHLNLAPGKMNAYASFLADVLEHFEKSGTHFDYLSPVNEPQWDWDDAQQEGTPAQNEEIFALVRSLSEVLSQRGLDTRILIGEAGTIGHAAMPMQFLGLKSDGRDDQARYFFSEQSPSYIGKLPNVESTISAHSYFSVWPLEKQIEYREMVGKALQACNPKLGYWQSEYCILEENGEIRHGQERDLGMNTALFVARIIHHDLTLLNAKSWQWWTAVTHANFKDGLIYLDDGSQADTGRMGDDIESLLHDGAIRESKLLWAFGNYARFVRPGMVRVECTVTPASSSTNGLLASSYKNPKGELTTVLINLSQEELVCDLGPNKTATVYSTSATSDLEKYQQNATQLKLPPRSISTCITK
jgi:O-glycosyl hydrolase